MNYAPNTTQWGKGDIVIHDADAKQPHMLMRVTGYDRHGLVMSEYIDPTRRRKIYHNEFRYLHDPALFNIDIAPALAQLASAPDAVRLCPQCDQPRRIGANGRVLQFCETHLREYQRNRYVPTEKKPKKKLTICAKCDQPRMVDSTGKTLSYCVEHQRELWRATAERRADKRGKKPKQPRTTSTAKQPTVSAKPEQPPVKGAPFVLVDETRGEVWVVTAVLSYRDTKEKALNVHTLRVLERSGQRVVKVVAADDAPQAEAGG